eukprot:Clim_evm16s5 gene=Clim_evmTU16s5
MLLPRVAQKLPFCSASRLSSVIQRQCRTFVAASSSPADGSGRTGLFALSKAQDLESKIKAERDRLTEHVQTLSKGGSRQERRRVQMHLAYLHRLSDLWTAAADISRDIEDTVALKEEDPEMADTAEEELETLREAYEDTVQSTISHVTRSLLMGEMAGSGGGDGDWSGASDDTGPGEVLVELRPGAGGDEAALFADDLLQLYERVCKREGWSFELLSKDTTVGGSGLRYGNFAVRGPAGQLQRVFIAAEAGVHRVQRIPATESSGRVHTSTAAVISMPKVDFKEVEMDMKDVRIEVMRAGGAGGQHVNTTESAVRVTHEPTGLQAYSANSRSQLQNKDKALAVLASKLRDMQLEAEREKQLSQRRAQVTSLDRNERIRTYNWPQDRVTDHRTGTNFSLSSFMDGDHHIENAEELQAQREANAARQLTVEDVLDPFGSGEEDIVQDAKQ